MAESRIVWCLSSIEKYSRRIVGGTVPIGRTAIRIMDEVSMLVSGSIFFGSDGR